MTSHASHCMKQQNILVATPAHGNCNINKYHVCSIQKNDIWLWDARACVSYKPVRNSLSDILCMVLWFIFFILTYLSYPHVLFLTQDKFSVNLEQNFKDNKRYLKDWFLLRVGSDPEALSLQYFFIS